jgi:hypothetical protein
MHHAVNARIYFPHIKYKALNKRCHDLMDVTVHKNSGSIQNVPHWWDFLFLLLLSKGYE